MELDIIANGKSSKPLMLERYIDVREYGLSHIQEVQNVGVYLIILTNVFRHDIIVVSIESDIFIAKNSPLLGLES